MSSRPRGITASKDCKDLILKNQIRDCGRGSVRTHSASCQQKSFVCVCVCVTPETLLAFGGSSAQLKGSVERENAPLHPIAAPAAVNKIALFSKTTDLARKRKAVKGQRTPGEPFEKRHCAVSATESTVAAKIAEAPSGLTTR